ncbi:hypothetical protein BC828DRAFT_407821 [Blastocladiella britannica]|nr:hypothetical protein BC828DRAFT_407821 [Blastocladiella britannica]
MHHVPWTTQSKRPTPGPVLHPSVPGIAPLPPPTSEVVVAETHHLRYIPQQPAHSGPFRRRQAHTYEFDTPTIASAPRVVLPTTITSPDPYTSAAVESGRRAAAAATGTPIGGPIASPVETITAAGAPPGEGALAIDKVSCTTIKVTRSSPEEVPAGEAATVGSVGSSTITPALAAEPLVDPSSGPGLVPVRDWVQMNYDPNDVQRLE